jgi:hypothetical protein
MKITRLLFILACFGLLAPTFGQQNRAYSPVTVQGFGSSGGTYTNTSIPNSSAPIDREMSVICGILEKLIQQEFNNGDTAVNIRKIEGAVVPGSGVLLTVVHRQPFHNVRNGGLFSQRNLLGASSVAGVNARYGVTTSPCNDCPPPAKDPCADCPATASIPKLTKGQYATVLTAEGFPAAINRWGTQEVDRKTALRRQDSTFSSKVPRLKRVMERFFSEYGVLFTQVKPQEKIWVNWTYAEDSWYSNAQDAECSLVGSISKQDALALGVGKASPAELAKKVSYHQTHCQEEPRDQELEVFGAILERLYSQSSEGSLIHRGRIAYKRINGYGIQFEMGTLTLPQYFNDMYFPNEKDRTQYQADYKKGLELFEKGFAGSLLDYSRVLRSLKTGELLQISYEVNAGFDENNRTLKREVIYTIPQNLLADFDSGKINKEQALQAIKKEEKLSGRLNALLNFSGK